MGAKMGLLVSCRATFGPKYFVKITFPLLLPLLVSAQPGVPPVAQVTFSPLTKAAYLQAKKAAW
jgi:hypothetical protein